MAVELTTLAIYASLATAAVGTGVAVYGQQQQAKAAEATAKYNARLQEQQAAQENAVAAENARRKAVENRRTMAAHRAALAQSGLTLEGSPLAVLGDMATEMERDILDIGFDGDTRARALRAGAAMSRWEGQQTASSLRTSSYATALSGASSAASGYLTNSGNLAKTRKTP